MNIDLDFFAKLIGAYDSQHPIADAIDRHIYQTVKSVIAAVRQELEVMTRDNGKADKSEEDLMTDLGASILATMLDKKLADVLEGKRSDGTH